MANIDDGFRIESLSLNDNVLITEGTLDPSTGLGYEAPIGSLYINRTVGDMYQKVGIADVDWTKYGDTQTINFMDVFAAAELPTGFVNRTDSTISFNDTTRTFTIAPVTTSFDYYIKGAVHTIGSAKTFTLPNTTNTYIIYFDGSEILQYTNAFGPVVFTDNAIVAIIYWNATLGKAVYIADERHSASMPSSTHAYLHNVIGAKYDHGLLITATSGGTTNADVEISVEPGEIRDEDLTHSIVSTGNKLHSYDLEQALTLPAQIPVLYRSGTGEWANKPADNFPIIYNGTAGYTGTFPPYNKLTGSTWSLTSPSAGNYVLLHIVATNDIRYPISAIQGLAQYSEPPTRDEAYAELKGVSGLPFNEMVPIGTVVVHCITTANTINARFAITVDGATYLDWRQTIEFGTLTVQGVTDHGNLSGLVDDDHPQYAQAGAGSTRTFNIADLLDVTGITPTNGVEYGLKWNAGSSVYDISTLTFAGLNDIAITASPAINGWTIVYNSATSKWIASPVGDVLPLTTKGDLLTHDATSYTRLGVGADGTVLTADTLSTSGVKWAMPADKYVLTSATDTVPNYLDGKLVASTNITPTVTGTTDKTMSFDLTNTGIVANTYTKLTVDAKGRVTAATNPTTLAGYNISDAYTMSQVDSHTWDWATRITGKPTTLAGYGITDAPTLVTTTPGTYRSVTVNSQGQVTAGTNPTTLAGYGITNAVVSNAAITAGTYRSVTVDTKGLVTAGTNPTTLAGYAITDAVNTSSLGVASGVATLDATGKLSASQLPALAITDTFVVTAPSNMLVLTAQVGDVAVVTSTGESYILQNSDPTVLANWIKISSPGGGVTSVDATAPAAGLTITGGPITTTGSLTFTLANDIGAVESLSTIGIAVRTATDTWATRTITGTTNQISVTNGSGVAGNPVLAIATDPVIPGTGALTLPSGNTAARPATPTSAMLRYSTTLNNTEFFNGTTWVQSGTNTTNATVSSVNATGSTGLAVSGGPITTSGTLSFVLGTELQGLSQLGVNGMVARTASGTYTPRSVSGIAGQISVTNGDGAAGNPTIGLSTAGTTGTYGRVTTDAYGRVVSGTNDSLSLLSDVVLTAPTNGNVLKYDGTNWINSTSSPSSSSGVLSTWTLISGNRYYADFTHGLGTNDVVISLFNNTTNALVFADSIVQTSSNTVRVTVVGNTIAVRIVVIANGLVIPAALPNVVNNLQVINAGGSPSIQQDLIANRPAAGTAGRLFLSTDSKILFRDTGTQWDILTSSQGVIRTLTFFANSLDSPVNADFVINALAPTISDPVNSAFNVRSFSNTVEQGVSFMITPPLGATIITFKTKGRAGTAPGAAAVVQPRIYTRSIPANGAVSAWSAAVEFANIAIPTNAFYQYNDQSFTLSSLGLTIGTLYQFELTRRVTGITGGTNLAFPWYLVDLTVEFT